MIKLTHCKLSTCDCEFVLSFDYSVEGEPIESINKVISVCSIHSWMPPIEAIQSALAENRAQNLTE
jgi:hypothetical protein